MTGVLFKGIHDAIQEWRSGDKTFNQLLLAVGESAAKLVGQAACGMSCAWLGTQVGLAAGGGVGAAVGFAAGSVLHGLFAKFHLEEWISNFFGQWRTATTLKAKIDLAFETLGLSPNSTLNQVKTRYRRLLVETKKLTLNSTLDVDALLGGGLLKAAPCLSPDQDQLPSVLWPVSSQRLHSASNRAIWWRGQAAREPCRADRNPPREKRRAGSAHI